MRKYEIWSEGYRMNSEGGTATFEGSYEAESFEEACEIMVHEKGYEDLYNKKYNTIWGCRLFDNEADARRSFG